jgi:hypothetical protein
MVKRYPHHIHSAFSLAHAVAMQGNHRRLHVHHYDVSIGNRLTITIRYILTNHHYGCIKVDQK